MDEDVKAVIEALERIAYQAESAEITPAQAERALQLWRQAQADPSGETWAQLEAEISQTWPARSQYTDILCDYASRQQHLHAPVLHPREYANDLTRFVSQRTTGDGPSLNLTAAARPGAKRPRASNSGASAHAGVAGTGEERTPELLLYGPEFLTATGAFAAVGTGAPMAAHNFKFFVGSGSFNHVQTPDDELIHRIHLSQHRDANASDMEFVAACGARVGKATDVTCEMLNCDLRSALTQLCALDGTGEWGILVAGTKHPDWSVVFASDARLIWVVKGMAMNLADHLSASSIVVEALPTLSELPSLPTVIAARGLWGTRRIVEVKPGAEPERQILVTQEHDGSWKMDESGTARWWEPNLTNRGVSAEEYLSPARLRAMLYAHELDPWDPHGYSAPLFLIKAPRWIVN